MSGRRGGEWTGEMTLGRNRTSVLHGHQARKWSGLLVAPQCPPSILPLVHIDPFFSYTALIRSYLEGNKRFLRSDNSSKGLRFKVLLEELF